METRYKLPSRLKYLRTSKGITQEDLAKAIGVSRQSVHFYESGRMKVSAERAVDIAEFFGVSLDTLVGLAPLVID